jgi:hypothetical protein
MWEDDFEKSDFWTRKAPAKQARVQLSNDLNMPSHLVLHVMCSSGICLIDTCSDVSLARPDVLLSVREADIPVVVNHLGRNAPGNDHVLHGVFAVAAHDLPAGVVALIGLSDVRQLGLSLDAIADHPASHWEDARLRPRQAGFFRRAYQLLSRCCPLFSSPRRALPPPADAVENLREEAAPLREPCEPREVQRPEPRQNDEPREDQHPVPRRYRRLPRAYLQELKERSALEQHNRTIDRIGRLFLTSPPVKKKGLAASTTATIPREDWQQSSSSVEPSAVRRGNKYYGIRAGRKIGVVETWAECKELVDGIPFSEFKSFFTRDARRNSTLRVERAKEG